MKSGLRADDGKLPTERMGGSESNCTWMVSMFHHYAVYILVQREQWSPSARLDVSSCMSYSQGATIGRFQAPLVVRDDIPNFLIVSSGRKRQKG